MGFFVLRLFTVERFSKRVVSTRGTTGKKKQDTAKPQARALQELFSLFDHLHHNRVLRILSHFTCQPLCCASRGCLFSLLVKAIPRLFVQPLQDGETCEITTFQIFDEPKMTTIGSPFRVRRFRRTVLEPNLSPIHSTITFDQPSAPDELPAPSPQISPRKASSILRGSMKSLAIGRLGITPRDGNDISAEQGDFSLVDGVEEITVSLSKSSSWMSPRSSSPTLMSTPSSEPAIIPTEGLQQQELSPYAHFMDTFRYSPRTGSFDEYDGGGEVLKGPQDLKEEESPPQCRSNPFIESPQHRDEFFTAYTSQGNTALHFDQVVTPTKTRPRLGGFRSKVKIKKLTLPPDTQIVLSKPVVSSSPPTTEAVSDREHQFRKELVFWDTKAASHMKHLGKTHHDTAESFLSLGHAHMRLNEYAQAMDVFQTSCEIFKSLDGPTHLSVARALDAFGLAALRFIEGGTICLIQAKTALEEAFAIRFHNLGVWHADTVETFNKVGHAYLRLGRIREAAKACREVYLVRKAIYGDTHPSVAISAHGLANIYFRMRQLKEACYYFDVALDVYKSMRLSSRHPTMIRLQKDRERLEASREL